MMKLWRYGAMALRRCGRLRRLACGSMLRPYGQDKIIDEKIFLTVNLDF
jgi:hypothetical protein